MSKYIKTNLSYLRFSQGRLSQKTVSEATGIGQKTLSALETGASKGIEFNTLLRLCTFFNCSPSELLLIEEDPQEVPVSDESRQKAKLLVARGLHTAMQAPAAPPEQVWAEFDAVRARMQEAAERAQSAKAIARGVS
ncbi:MAG: helix-turn-helix transcriptional regulator [Candidatus Melainabacteria bacterium]|nr:helix-turn-helix transcriptional regulator [Candidatus Melainabacteria bacterium]